MRDSYRSLPEPKGVAMDTTPQDQVIEVVGIYYFSFQKPCKSVKSPGKTLTKSVQGLIEALQKVKRLYKTIKVPYKSLKRPYKIFIRAS